MKNTLFIFILLFSLGISQDILPWAGSVNSNTIKGSQEQLFSQDSATNAMHIVSKGIVSVENSTSIPLEEDSTFTGDAIEVINYGIIFINVYTDVISAVDGLKIEQSSDGINWDHDDVYTIAAGQAENYAINPHAQYLRIVYTNGGTIQGIFRLQTILKGNSKPSSHRIGDVVTDDDDAEMQKVVIAYRKSPDNVYNNVDVQNPLPIDGDAVYCKDVWEDKSDIGDFSGSVCDLFDDLHTIISDTTSNDPKELIIHFNRTVVSNVIGLGAYSGNFSNVEVQILLSGDAYVTVADESSDDTKFTTRIFQFPVTAGFNGIKIRFHTTDTITISNCVVPKTIGVVARLQATKPDNTVTDINATNGGNLKISIEELENTISVNSNSQLRVTPFAVSGTEYKQDSITGAFTTIDYPHHEIHSGRHYFIEGYQLLGDGDSLIFVFNANDTTRWAHMLFTFSSTTSLHFQLFEGAIANGLPLDTLTTRMTPINNNRNSINTSVHDVFYGQTIAGFVDPDSLGTVLYPDSIGVSGGIPSRPDIGGETGREDEIITRQNTTYIWLVVSTAAANVCRFKGNWYEHINAN